MDEGRAPDTLSTASSAARPAELELWSNRRLIHPLSRWLARRLVSTFVSPDMVSVAGAVMAATGAAAYTLLPRPWGAMLGFACHFLWHVLDGADGELARRTGRSSTHGELVDGICDYAGRTILYLALGAFAARQFGAWIWLLAVFVGLSRIVQANFYETVRREYRSWVYGTSWIRQDLPTASSGSAKSVGGVADALGRLFLAVSAKVTPDSSMLDAAVARRAAEDATGLLRARVVCRERLVPVVRRASILSANSETLVIFLSMLAGSPVYLFAYVAVFLNGAYAVLYADQRTRFRQAAETLAEEPAKRQTAAAAPPRSN